MDIVKIVSISVSSIALIILLRKLGGDYAVFASCAINLFITFFSLGILLPVFDYIKQLTQQSQAQKLISVMFKSAGVCLLCTVGAEVCRDSGESSVASKIELAGKCTLIAYSLPLIKEVLAYAQRLLD